MATLNNYSLAKLRKWCKTATLTSLVLGVLIFSICIGIAVYGITHPDPRGSDYNGWVLFGVAGYLIMALCIGIPLIAIAAVSRRLPSPAAIISFGLMFLIFPVGIVFLVPAVLNAIVWRMEKKIVQSSKRSSDKSLKKPSCPLCGIKLSTGSSYCTRCGKMIHG